ncbi:hypothetical protein V6N13_108529 [Hibiscus sabdariffa]|uniref:Uncharacterized protein n=1 Tax=Hibiscus sabdariffa TaxID=183260 RepID=A0ABR2SSG6_9ROSI
MKANLGFKKSVVGVECRRKRLHRHKRDKVREAPSSATRRALFADAQGDALLTPSDTSTSAKVTWKFTTTVVVGFWVGRENEKKNKEKLKDL